MRTAFKLGARRGTILRLFGSETALVLGLAGALALGIVLAVRSGDKSLVAWLLGAGF